MSYMTLHLLHIVLLRTDGCCLALVSHRALKEVQFVPLSQAAFFATVFRLHKACIGCLLGPGPEFTVPDFFNLTLCFMHLM